MYHFKILVKENPEDIKLFYQLFLLAPKGEGLHFFIVFTVYVCFWLLIYFLDAQFSYLNYSILNEVYVV